MEKARFLQDTKNARAAWLAALDRITPDQLTQPGTAGAMSVRDILAHILWHEKQMIGVLEQRALAGSAWWELPTDERNARILAEFEPLSPAAELRAAAVNTQKELEVQLIYQE